MTMNRVPQNLSGPAVEIERIDVGSWCPQRDGKGPATEVHMLITLKGVEERLVLRYKSPRGLDEMIKALTQHRFDVWPG